jgi:hypothetical protein
MQLTTRDVISASNALAVLGKSKVKDAKLCYWLAVTPRKLQDAVEGFDKAQSQTLEKHAEYKKGEAGKEDKWDFGNPENKRMYVEEINTVLGQEDEYPVKAYKFSALFAEEGLNLTPELVAALGPLVELDVEE